MTLRISRPQLESICAVIITYRPDNAFSERVKTISPQVGCVVIVDNHSNPTSTALLKQIASQTGMHLILNDKNYGIAVALNQGVNWAIRQGYKWALLFDQDTKPDEDLVESFIHIYDDFPEKDRLAVIGANFIGSNIQKPMFIFEAMNKFAWADQRNVITSGSLISLSIFRQIGPFRDDFFIDLVDHDYCLKARKKGFRVIIVCKPLMKHSIGAVTIHNFFGRSTGSTNHSAIRRYYMMRNHVLLFREYFFDDPWWVISSSWRRIKTILLICLFEKDKYSKLKGTLYGLIHGLNGRLGEFEKHF